MRKRRRRVGSDSTIFSGFWRRRASHENVIGFKHSLRITNQSVHRRRDSPFQEEQHGKGPMHWSADCGGLVIEVYPARMPDDVDTAAA